MAYDIPPEHRKFCYMTHAERKKRLCDLHIERGNKKTGSKEHGELVRLIEELEDLHQKTTAWERIGS